ncbi:MAG: hypothetical protein Q8R69_23635, partial [Telluria sp.]|nr:hypothetical protein [Telluria sp.]
GRYAVTKCAMQWKSIPSLAPIDLQSASPAWGNLTRPRVGEFEVANGGDRWASDIQTEFQSTHNES